MRAFLLLFALAFSVAAQAEEAKTSTMTVQGEAVTRLAPDQVTLPVSIIAEDTQLKVAKDAHDAKLRKLLVLAGDAGIPKEKIQTAYTSVNPQYDYRDGKQIFRDYRVQTSIDFTLTDISKLGRFMNSVIDAGISDLGNVRYSLQSEDKVKEDTLNLALEHAHAKALRLAGTARMTLDKPLAIEEGAGEFNMPIPRPALGQLRMKAAFASPPELPSGQIEIHQSVTVTYVLK